MSSTAVHPENRFRAWLLALLFAASFLNYFDRQTLSVLKTTLKTELRLDDSAYALLVNLFTGCYAAAYIGSGWLVDRIGPRRALAWFVSVWSAATVACGFASNFVQLAVLRSVLGLAEPGGQPVSIRAATAWAPAHRRGLFMSLCGLGSSVGAIAAPPLIAWLAVKLHWRVAFVVPGLLGLGVAALWWTTYRDPRAVPAADAAPVEKTAPALAWAALWREPALWGIVLSRLLSDPVWYFLLFWFPGFLQEHKGATLEQLGFVGWLPFVAGNLGGIGCSLLSDLLARRDREPLRARKRLLLALSLLGPVCALIPAAAGLSATLALFCVVAVVCSCWLYTLAPVIAETFPLGNVASVWGIAGAFGASGAMVFNHFVGRSDTVIGQENLFFTMAVLHPAAAFVLFALVRRPAATGGRI